jgi:hypothetical protein
MNERTSNADGNFLVRAVLNLIAIDGHLCSYFEEMTEPFIFEGVCQSTRRKRKSRFETDEISCIAPYAPQLGDFELQT